MEREVSDAAASQEMSPDAEDVTEDEADAGGYELVRQLALMARLLPPSTGTPKTELEAKQERLRQVLATLTLLPPHDEKQ